MKKLNKSKVYYLGDLNSEQRAYLYAVLLSDDESFSIVRESEFKIEASDYVLYNGLGWDWCDEKDFKRFFNLEVVNALTLIEEEEWKPKQGDKVLVSNNKSYWVEGEFITEYKNEFIVKFNNEIIGRKHIKPYEDEIKVGDWVKEDDKLIKITESNVVFYDAYNEEYTKITNPELIELLNNEL